MRNVLNVTGARSLRDSMHRIVTDPTVMRDVLGRHLRPLGEPQVDIVDCRPGPLRQPEGFRCVVEYKLRLRTGDQGGSRMQTVSVASYAGGMTREIWQRLEVDQIQAAAASADALFAPFAFVPGLDLLVQVFPYDHRLTALAPLLNDSPLARRTLLSEIAPETTGDIEQWRAEQVRYRPCTRATVRLSIPETSRQNHRAGASAIYAKLYPTLEESRHAHETLRALRQRCEVAAPGFFVAKPIAHSASWHTAVQSEVPGIPLHKFLRRHEDPLPAVRIAARAMADFHGLDFDLRSAEGAAAPRSLLSRLARLKRAEEALRSGRPDLVRHVSETVELVVAGLSDTVLGPTHGDFKPDHLLFDGQDVSIIDFDYLHESDPILDVATMQSHLMRAEPRRRHATNPVPGYARAFVDEYFGHAPATGRRRLSCIQAMSHVLNAARYLQQGTESESHDWIAEQVHQARILLEGQDR